MKKKATVWYNEYQDRLVLCVFDKQHVIIEYVLNTTTDTIKLEITKRKIPFNWLYCLGYVYIGNF